MSIEDVSYFQNDLGIAYLVLASIGLADVIGTWILSRPVLEQLFQSFEVVALYSLFNEHGHCELLRDDDFVGRDARITGNNTSSELAGLLSHDLATNRSFLATKQGLERLLRCF